VLERGDVQRAALAAVGAVRAPQDLGDHPAGVDAARQQVAVVAVRGEAHVAGLELLERRDAGHLLPDVDVEVAHVEALGQRDQRLLEAPDDEHPPVDVQEPIPGKVWQHD
jgi:hypothetical protein